MTRSLAGRLLIGVVVLVMAGLLIADSATYVLLQNSLLNRVDAQLTSHSTQDTARTVLGNDCRLLGPGAPDFPTNTVAALYSPDGTELASCVFRPFGSTSSAAPQLPKTLPNAGSDHPVQPFTVEGSGAVGHYRVTDWPEDSFNGSYVVFAIPIDDIDSTLSQLLLLEGVIGAIALVGIGLLALLIIRVGLRPLDRMRAVAQDIAKGDLTRRVEPATNDTEIGRLGLALNGMLAQIEAAFTERTKSETRLRRFIADASHELRTPLTSVRGYAEMLRRGAEKSPEDSAVARRRIEEESVRMSVIVDDMLALARLGQGRPLESQPVDLQKIARDAVADAHAVSPQRKISLHAPDEVMITGDDTRLRQALGNLVRNALVHTPPETPIEVGVTTDDGFARVTVADHGPGLGTDDTSRVFEPFYRADPSRSRDSGGVGLGLSIAAAVVTAHGGDIRVSETPGGGATFEMDLPVKRAAQK